MVVAAVCEVLVLVLLLWSLLVVIGTALVAVERCLVYLGVSRCEQVRSTGALAVETVWCETMTGVSRKDVGI